MKRNDSGSIRLKGFSDLIDVGAELVDLILGEGINKRHLAGILPGDGLNFILAEDVDSEDVSGEGQSSPFVIGIVHLRFCADGAADDISDSRRRFQRDLNAPADEVAFHQRNELTPSLRIGRHYVQRVPDEFEDGGLSRASRTDNAVQIFREVEVCTPP